MILITAFYIAVRPQPLIDGILALFPPAAPRPRRASSWSACATAWVGWMQGVLVDMLVTGVLLYIGLTLIGLDLAIFFAVFSALLVVIPYFGSVIGGVPPVLFGLTESPEQALLALGVYVLVQQIEGNVIIPLVMAQRVKLHPALIAIGVVVVGQLFGFIGLFVAVPIISAAVILTDELWVKPNEEQQRAPHGVGDRPDPGAERPGARPGSADIRHPSKPHARSRFVSPHSGYPLDTPVQGRQEENMSTIAIIAIVIGAIIVIAIIASMLGSQSREKREHQAREHEGRARQHGARAEKERAAADEKQARARRESAEAKERRRKRRPGRARGPAPCQGGREGAPRWWAVSP